MFQNGVWNRTLSDVLVFDDVFVDQNVYSGLAVGAEHRQNLHELILGAQGVALNRELQRLVARIEEHNVALRDKAGAIPAADRGQLSVDEFCALPPRADIDEAIHAAERNLAAAHAQDPIRNAALFDPLSLPAFDLATIERVLLEDLPSLDAGAATRVQEHLARLGPGGETWVGEGMRRVAPEVAGGPCPFCAQDLNGSPVIRHYRAYFSEAYSNLKHSVSATLAQALQTHGGSMLAAFERAVRVAIERRQFWSQFCDVPVFAMDTAAIVRDWQTARDAIAGVLAAKQAAPLEPSTLPPEVRAAVAAYEAHRQQIVAISNALGQANESARLVKEQAATADPHAIARDLSRLRVTKARHSATIASLCEAYLAEKSAKAQTEQERDRTRAVLDQYRTNVFPGYQTAVNVYLERFNAEFRLDRVAAVQTRGGPTCTYNVTINNTPVPIGGGQPQPGQLSFRNTLSSGDRNALALAFFFASLDQDPRLANKVVVVDDPISSLDEHRSLTTVQEIRRLAERAGQVIVLSHSRPLLCDIWEHLGPPGAVALQLVRVGSGSTIRTWDVEQDSVTEHDRRHAMLRDYLGRGTTNAREAASAIRPLLERFLRVACPEHFPPGTLLGQFHRCCAQRIGTPQEILDATATRELGDLLEYSNRFHHDTNPAWETQNINDVELAGFVRRALAFANR
jgi:wobble nucleotide-excising tRNase